MNGFPRTRGDGPLRTAVPGIVRAASPHTRGWTHDLVCLRPQLDGFPAHAGMDPCGTAAGSPTPRLPRTRGDGPPTCPPCIATRRGFPHTRGWTSSASCCQCFAGGFPAHAGMDPPCPFAGRARADGFPTHAGMDHVSARTPRPPEPASPHTRGWTRWYPAAPPRHHGFPAHAGMDPMPRTGRASR